MTNPKTTVELEAFIASLRLESGQHKGIDDGACIMEAVAYVAGEPFSDHPQCASPVIAAFLRAWNDGMNDKDRQQLKPLIPRLVGTAASPAVEKRRAWMALDWYCRVSAPAWLRAAGLTSAAEAVEATAPIVDRASAKKAQGALNMARKEADAAWDAAGAAAGAAAAAAWAAARAAAADAVRPTVVLLQTSALELLDRLIEVAA